MGNSHDSIALDWVRGEIAETLTQSQQALEAYIDHREDTTRLRFCLNYLHQVHGTLQMVELYGAALLAEEMEKLTQALLNDEVANIDDAISALLQGILHLPQYLEKMHSSRDDFPMVLLPVLNDLRAARGETLLSDTSLFKPDLSPARFTPTAAVGQRLQDDRVLANLRKLRQMFQFALVGIIREQDLPAHFGYAHKVIERMIKVTRQTPRGELWKAAGAFIETLQHGVNPVSTAVKSILRDMDAELRRMIDESVDILQQPVPEALLKNTLYYVARARELQTDYVTDIRARFDLEKALPSEEAVSQAREKVARPNRQAISSVVDALNEELGALKDMLDLFVRSEYRENNELEELMPGLQQVSNTLAVLGLGVPRRVISEQQELLERLVSSEAEIDDTVLMDIAGALLYVEATLAGLNDDSGQERELSDANVDLGSREIGDANSALLRESRNTLEQVKTAVVNFIASQWKIDEIQQVPELLHSVCGGLRLIPLERACGMLEAARDYVSDVLIERGQVPGWQQLDTLADLLTSIEYYLERLAEGVTDNAAILDIAEESLSQLDFSAGDKPSWEEAEDPAGEVASDDTQSLQPPEAPGPADSDSDTDAMDIDDEILEIFGDEAEEVLAAIHQHYPTLRKDPTDQHALTEVRRACHTLKGSGRLVGAAALGDLAWALEKMLNKVLDGSIRLNDDMLALMDDSFEQLPQLISQFRNREPASDVSHLIARADELIAGRAPAPEDEPEDEFADMALEDEASTQEESVADETSFTEEAASLEEERSDEEEPSVEQEPSAEQEPSEEPQFSSDAESAEEYDVSAEEEFSTAEAPASEETEVTASDEVDDRQPGVTDVLDEDFIDEEILEIFLEEAQEVLGTINEYLPILLRDLNNQSALTEVRRAYHTLKGSGRMVGANTLGELCWAIENLMNRVLEGNLPMTDRIAELTVEATDKIPVLISDFQKRQPPSVNTAALEQAAHDIATGKMPVEESVEEAPVEQAVDASDEDAVEQETVEANLPQEAVTAEDVTDDEFDPFSGELDESGVDPLLLEIFESEAETHQQALRDFVASAEGYEPVPYTDDVSRALHTLKGSANTAGIKPIAEVISPLERFVKDARASNLKATGDVTALIAQACDFIDAGLEQITHSPYDSLPGSEAYLERVDSLYHQTFDQRPEEVDAGHGDAAESDQVAMFRAEGLDVLLDADRILDEWAAGSGDTLPIANLRDELGALVEHAERASQPDIQRLAEQLFHTYQQTLGNNVQPSASLFMTLRTGHDHLINMMDQLAAGLAPQSDQALLDELAGYEARGGEDAPDPFNTEFSEDLDEIDRVLAKDLEKDDFDSEDDFDSQYDGEMPFELTDDAESTSGSTAANNADIPTLGDDAEVNSELVDLFLEEANDLIDSMAESLDRWSAEPQASEPLRSVQRELHTLKGGARLAELGAIGDLAHELETLIDGVVEGRLDVSDGLMDLLYRGYDRLHSMTESLSSQSPLRPAPDLLKEIADYVAHPSIQADTTAHQDEADDDQKLDPELLGIFLEEAYDLVNSTGSALHDWSEDPSNRDLAAQLQRDVHTLKGGARMAGVDPIGDLTHELETLFERVAEGQIEPSRDMLDMLFSCHDRLAEMVEHVATGQIPSPAEDLIEQITAILAADSGADQQDETSADEFDEDSLQVIESDQSAWSEDESSVEEPSAEEEPSAHEEPSAEEEPLTEEEPSAEEQPSAYEEEAQPAEAASSTSSDSYTTTAMPEDLSGVFLDEGLEIHAAIREYLAQWREEPAELTGVTQLHQELHTLKGGARLADIDPIADLAEAWHDALEPLLEGRGNHKTLLPLSEVASETLGTMLQSLENNQPVDDQLTLIEQLEQAQAADVEAWKQEQSESAESSNDPIDPEVLEIFLEEAGELVDQLENLLADWRKQPTQTRFNQEIQRVLHTLKGGARLSELTGLGDQAHDFETRLIDLGGNEPSASDWEKINADHDALLNHINAIRGQAEAGAPITPASTRSETEAKADQQKEPEKPATKSSSKAGPAAKPVADNSSRAERRQARQAEAARAAQETIRVSAPLLDELVNLAGETSITRGRLEQQNSDFHHILDEMTVTIDRLREQLRRMEIETEAQILFRAEQEHGPDYGEDFDPLEMDRYSAIQQLSRALTESTSDLADLRDTMQNKVRDTETLLVQQSRINTELQEGLMKTRMVPFASMVPRLRRIVRQISGELGKRVEFDVRNADGEMDRNILERMVAPLEHMLRNAVDHGIEMPQDRRKAGKQESGEVILSLTREGGEVVLRMMDDGAGIRSDVIRKKAISQGLLGKKEEISDREVLQFILQPGFSTAAKVTQISGRGVGMDVVASEIKQLGGSLDIDSDVGRGTTFTVRLPFTVSVNRALMVSSGEDLYAIPLNTIEGIVRVSGYELEHYYGPDAPLYEYAGEEYRMQYLGSLLHTDNQPKLQGQPLPLPVILVRGADQPVALQVDSLLGSREIVVKSLGRQFNSVRGVSGATILGDGNVVIILDLPAMLRSDILMERQRSAETAKKAASKAQAADRQTLVMVVDDSVTVRKVTSRLLERHGMSVVTAKDGLDAVALLQEYRPDLILLDIEMPRMDGFEVASFVRHDSRLKTTPICMITSRTGEKHRERALSIGVNEYLGKPFQEADLLATIGRLTGHEE